MDPAADSSTPTGRTAAASSRSPSPCHGDAGPGTRWPERVLAPALDVEVVDALAGERLDAALGQLDVGDERDPEVHGPPPDDVVVGQFFFMGALRDVDHEVDALAAEVLEDVRAAVVERPVQHGRRNR